MAREPIPKKLPQPKRRAKKTAAQLAERKALLAKKVIKAAPEPIQEPVAKALTPLLQPFVHPRHEPEVLQARHPGKIDVKKLAEQFGPEAIEGLIEIARNGVSERGRIAAYQTLLDRGFGRPVQPIAGKTEDEDLFPLLDGTVDPIDAARAYQKLMEQE